MYPPFWQKGNFLVFLRLNWRPALEMIICLVNFATDRHQEWWDHAEVTIRTPKGEVRWKGHPHVFAWHHHNMNSADVVTCALMALEKWFDEQLKEGKSTKEAVESLYEKSTIRLCRIAHQPRQTISGLVYRRTKTIAFIQHFYICDLHSTRNYFGVSFWPHDGKMINKLQREWSQLPDVKPP